MAPLISSGIGFYNRKAIGYENRKALGRISQNLKDCRRVCPEDGFDLCNAKLLFHKLFKPDRHYSHGELKSRYGHGFYGSNTGLFHYEHAMKLPLAINHAQIATTAVRTKRSIGKDMEFITFY